MTDDGARAARELGQPPAAPHPLLSQHVETAASRWSWSASRGGFGYLLKDRVFDVADFLDAVRRVSAGGSALDPEVVQALLAPARSDDVITTLSEREREVLELVAEGRSNAAIASHLTLAERTVETHMRAIFQKLRLPDTREEHRRVLAVLAFVRSRSS